jgi:death-on-curing protein
VLFLHDQALREYGGMQGVKDEGPLGSALGRPLNKFHYAACRDLFDLAAAYAFGIARNHPFNDANKRTAWACCVVFLKLNGVEINLPAPDIVDHMIALAQGDLDEPAFSGWLRNGVILP